ncbi:MULTISPECIES: hypothetical protein [Pseudomonas]|uniref:hypothetical protein n=1 Tax=Pseudomonas TaxID=286 RepID=UPI0012E8D0AB|nr:MULTISPECIES: hypothetical protein [Pseudomonas]MDT8924710.1 hypothetical protein [Pseudomonas taiwanensis]
MPLPTLAEQQLALAVEALTRIEEHSDDTDSRHAAQHALIRIRRMGHEQPAQAAQKENA